MKWVCNRAKLIAISNYTKSEIKKVMPELKIEVITPGFDLDFWTFGKADDDVAIKFRPYILSVGALKPRKGYYNSIMAFAAVAEKIGGLNYVIVGQGEESDYAKNLKKIISENGLEKRVFFVSAGIDDNQLLGFYKNAELFVLTPVEENHHFEGFGIVYLEAAASGLPIVATDKNGATSAVSDVYNGTLVPQNDPAVTAKTILRILENSELKTRFAKNGREWVKGFSWDKIIKKYIEIYNAKHH